MTLYTDPTMSPWRACCPEEVGSHPAAHLPHTCQEAGWRGISGRPLGCAHPHSRDLLPGTQCHSTTRRSLWGRPSHSLFQATHILLSIFPCDPGALCPRVTGKPPLPPGQEAGSTLGCQTGWPRLGEAGPQFPALHTPAELAAATVAPGCALSKPPELQLSGRVHRSWSLAPLPTPTLSSRLGDPQLSAGGKIKQPLPLSMPQGPGLISQICGLGWPGHRRCPWRGFQNSRAFASLHKEPHCKGSCSEQYDPRGRHWH